MVKSTFRYNSANNRGAWPPLFTQMLAHLNGLAAIASTEVVLEHQPGAKAPYRVQVRLELAGPRLLGVGSDSTLEEAVRKATEHLAQQIQSLKARTCGGKADSALPLPARKTGRRT